MADVEFPTAKFDIRVTFEGCSMETNTCLVFLKLNVCRAFFRCLILQISQLMLVMMKSFHFAAYSMLKYHVLFASIHVTAHCGVVIVEFIECIVAKNYHKYILYNNRARAGY